MPESEATKGTVARKARRTGWSKAIRKYSIQLSGLVLPTVR
jgi:hypothetical protein